MIQKKPIIILPEKLANMIAAGEVVERPASVVKELIENAIDASAKQIKVELTDSGLRKITVTDDGWGMTKEEIKLSIQRHATSKIANTFDLFSIITLGFRGEALPSIASVSKLSITSCHNGESGYQIIFEAGDIKKETPIAFPKGTKVEVENLFYNTPARLKHLSNASFELSQITNIISKCAIANPNISFSIFNNGKLIYKTPGTNNLLQVIAIVYGTDVANNLIYFENNNNLYQISGYASNNSIYRSNRNSINIVVNNRIIRNQSLLYAICESYKTILPIGKYPLVCIEIKSDPTLVDVNVHPSKLEIRFTDEAILKELITQTITQTLFTTQLITTPLEPLNSTKPTIIKVSETNEKTKAINLTSESLWEHFDESSAVRKNSFVNKLSENINQTYNNENFDYKIEIPKAEVEQIQLEEPVHFFKNLNYIGQYNRTYLLMEYLDDLYLVDQHAAMERFMYEKIAAELAKPVQSIYELLIPIHLDFSISEIALITEKLSDLVDIGITVEPFGNTTIIIRTIPTWIVEGLEVEFIRDIINHLINGKIDIKAKLFDSLAKQLSCKQSIKAHMSITSLEVHDLMMRLDECKMPYTCPHGRPTLIKFSKNEIEKMFKRIM